MYAQIQSALVALDSAFTDYIVAPLGSVLFFDVAFWDNGQPNEIALPAVVIWLVLGAMYFTLQFRFVNFRAF